MTNNDDLYRSPQSEVRDSYEGGTENVKPFSTKGRIGRAYYVIYSMGISSLIQIALVVLVAVVGAGLGESGVGISAVLAGLIYLALFVFQFIWAIRRAHDADMSGWMSLIIIIPLAFLVFWFLPGTKGPNKYGPAPKRGPLWLAVVIGMILPAIIFFGILAAIAIPAYQDYTQRAQVGQCMVATGEIRRAMAQTLQSTGEFPDEASVNAMMSQRPFESTYCSIDVESDAFRVVATFRNDDSVGPALKGRSVYYTYERVDGEFKEYCGSDSIPTRFMPRSCQ